jgi:hypothetical protein
VETARFEELLARPDMYEAHDVVTLRAVRIQARTLMTVQAFLKSQGQVFLFRSNGADSNLPPIVPPLAWDATYPLVESSGSQLLILKRQQFTAVIGRV